MTGNPESEARRLSQPIDPRPVTEQEAAVVEWLLDHAAFTDVSPYRAQPASTLQVVAKCGCGCASLDFELLSKEILPYVMLADAIAFYPDRQWCGLLLWGTKNHRIAWLEIYDMHPVNHRFPELANLRRWEDMSSELD